MIKNFSLALTDAVSQYQEGLDSLIDNAGKDIVLYFENTVSNVGVNWDDPLRHNDPKKPSFKQVTTVDPAPTITINTKIIKALIKDNPKEFVNFSLRLNLGSTVIRMKTYLSDVPDIKRCKYAKIHSSVGNIILGDFRLLMEPIPKGIQQDRYAISYWESIT